MDNLKIWMIYQNIIAFLNQKNLSVDEVLILTTLLQAKAENASLELLNEQLFQKNQQNLNQEKEVKEEPGQE